MGILPYQNAWYESEAILLANPLNINCVYLKGAYLRGIGTGLADLATTGPKFSMSVIGNPEFKFYTIVKL